MKSLLPPIVFEDDCVVAFDKPSGLLTAPDRWDKSLDNLMTLVHRYISPEYFNAHRIDRETSGIVLCAKTKPALDDLCKQFELREVKKEYVAIVRGAPAELKGIISKALAPDRGVPGKMRVATKGKPSETEYVVTDSWWKYSFVTLHPRTGRTHQLRVHLQAIGCPIVGDALYGSSRGIFLSELKRNYKPSDGPERPLIGRLALHSAGLTFRHPGTGQPCTVTAPLPKDFEVAVKYLRKFRAGG
jgi:RluA family pseudouridine synthase